ncbi:MAG TPA: hypothetical protein VF301_05180, partial [Ginsengibacter sp.]
MKSKHLLFFLTIYTSLFFILFPGYRYVIHPDSTGYLSVAEQLAKGNFHNSINGIWSPLGSWILTPFIKLNFDEILTTKYLNGFYGFLSLIAFFYLLKKFKVRFFIETAIMIGAVLLILQFSFNRLFDDLLHLLFMLLYLNIICSKKFGTNYKAIVLAGFIGGIAFYVKSYAFYFILIHLPIVIYLSGRKNSKNKITLSFLKKTFAGIIVLFVTVSFWIITLNLKYGHFILGQQNITGSLSPAYNQPRVVFYAPPFANAYSIFDDISYKKFNNITPFTNGKIFLAQLKLIVFNALKTIEHFNDFSFAFIIIILISTFLIAGKFKSFSNQNNIVLLFSFIIIWPLGFLLFHVEPRYLWIIDLSVLILAGVLLSFLIDNYSFNKKYLYLFSLIIIGSFYLYPLTELRNQYGSGKNYFEIANALKQNNIKGNLLFSNQSNEDFSESVIINYLAKCRHYGPFTTDYTMQEVLDAIKEYHINYFILYYNTPFQK